MVWQQMKRTLLASFFFAALQYFHSPSTRFPDSRVLWTNGFAPEDLSTSDIFRNDTYQFSPGSLNLPKSVSIARCLPTSGMGQRKYKAGLILLDSFRTGFSMQAKVGSSTLRNLTEQFWNGTVNLTHVGVPPGYKQMTMVRDPFQRFLSAWKETIRRLRLYHPLQKPGNLQYVPEEYRAFIDLALSLPPRDRNYFLKGNTSEVTNFNVEVLSTFVRDYDPDSFLLDRHLIPQTSRMWRAEDNNLMKRFDEVFEFENFDEELVRMGTMIGAPALPTILKARPSNFFYTGPDPLPSETIQKICRLNARDYCCLNYRLPTACEGIVACEWVGVGDVESNVMGKWDPQPELGKHEKYIRTIIRQTPR